MYEIRLINLSKRYKNKEVFKNLNLDIKKGELVVLDGISGSGKTTLLNMMGGIEEPTSGDVIISGSLLKKMNKIDKIKFYRYQVGLIFQRLNLYPFLNLAENISLPGIFANQKQEEYENRLEKLAKDLMIEDILMSKPTEVSGGQAERACIARAIFMRPKIILADEPTNNLDLINAENIMNIFYKIKFETGATIVIASHDNVVKKYAERVIQLGIRE